MPDHAANPDLVADCTALLAVKDALRGTSTLDWNATSTLSTWEGVTLNATSTRVTALVLGDEGLNGSVPLALGDLSALETLDLSDNDLAGEIPAELGSLANLQTLRLSGNSFTGCIPPTLADVTTNDLASLNIQYCRAPAPSGVSASLSDGTFSIGTVSATDEDGDTLTYEIAGGDPDGKFAIGNGTGSIPPELGDLSNLRSRYLHLFDHLFPSSVPLTIDNSLTGAILLNDDGFARYLDGPDDLFFHHHGLAGHLDCLRPAGRGEYQQHCRRCGDRQPTN